MKGSESLKHVIGMHTMVEQAQEIHSFVAPPLSGNLGHMMTLPQHTKQAKASYGAAPQHYLI